MVSVPQVSFDTTTAVTIILIMLLAFILGRLPEFSQLEIEAVLSTYNVRYGLNGPLRRVQNQSCLLEVKEESDFELALVPELQLRLGGVTRIAVLNNSANRFGLEKALAQEALTLPDDHKVSYGVSVFGTLPGAGGLGLRLKKALKAEGRSVRYIAPDVDYKQGLNTAQVFHNRLAAWGRDNQRQDKGRELVAIQDGESFWVGHTLTVQDVDSYSLRDFGIPVPDPLSGMLSPKLAQTMINLALRGNDPYRARIYDPFCGNGRVVEEAMLQGISAAYGSDIEKVRVEASTANTAWLVGEFGLPSEANDPKRFWVQDATQARALNDPRLAQDLSVNPDLYIITEPYLGRPLRQPLSVDQKAAWLKELVSLYERFFTVWSEAPKALRPKRMIVVFPDAKVQGGGHLSLYAHLVDRLGQLGYSSSVLSCYERPDSLVSRDIVQIEYRTN